MNMTSKVNVPHGGAPKTKNAVFIIEILWKHVDNTHGATELFVRALALLVVSWYGNTKLSAV
jgi:hypothetical protein